MSFLGRALSGSAKYLGKIQKAGVFLGKQLPKVAQASRGIQSLANNPSVKALSDRAGINPSVLRTIGQVSSTVGNAANLLPGTASDVRNIVGGAAAGTKRSLADLYQQANTMN
jgi:hypothetical protein